MTPRRAKEDEEREGMWQKRQSKSSKEGKKREFVGEAVDPSA